jgi:hypothetical protein
LRLTREVRALLREIQADLDNRERAYEAAARRLAAILVVATISLILVSIVLPIAASRLQPDLVGLTQSASSGAGAAVSSIGEAVLPPVSWQEIAGVELWGALGALVSGVVAIRGMRPGVRTEELPIAQLALKIPAGSVTAAFAIILIQANVIPLLRPIERGQVGAYAVLFGFAQEAVTRLIDRQASSLLDKSANL